MSKFKVCIDSGHGSNTPGKRTPDGYREHWANTNVANFFALALTRCGIDFIKTGWNDSNSKDDPDTAIATRQKTIKAAQCDCVVSFHFNACGDGKSYNSGEGIEVLISNTQPGDSKRLATLVLAQLVGGTQQKNRGIKTQALGMCNCKNTGAKAAILIECGFMTNKREAELMQSDAFCKECAEETARGLCAYLGVPYVGESATSEQPKETPKEKPIESNLASFTIKVLDPDLKIRKGPGTSYDIVGQVTKGVIYTIVETSGTWGKLKSGAGWISISSKYVQRL